jgi:hypothetical protein
MDDLVQRVLNAWADNEDSNETSFGVSANFRMAMATLAVEAIMCGARHPQRDTVRCTQLPHSDDAYHRDGRKHVEWCAGPEGLITVHDELGPITFARDFTPKLADATDDPGRYIKLPNEVEQANLRESELAAKYREVAQSAAPLLAAAGRKLHALASVYKGNTTRNALAIAQQCDQAARLIADLDTEDDRG